MTAEILTLTPDPDTPPPGGASARPLLCDEFPRAYRTRVAYTTEEAVVFGDLNGGRWRPAPWHRPLAEWQRETWGDERAA
jgi:hypothetical protein